MTISRLPALCIYLFLLTTVAADGDTSRGEASGGTGGHFRQIRNPDHPRIAVYGGIGLYPTGEGRWSGYGVTDAGPVDRLVQRCADHGVTQISANLLEEYQANTDLDVRSGNAHTLIHRLIRQAHERNILVYADVPVFGHTAVDRSFAQARPHVFTRSMSGEPDTHMLSPAYAEVREHKRNIFLAFVREFPFDGVHLDFIRFPYYTHDLREGSCKHGYDAPLLDVYRELIGEAEGYRPAVDDEAWITFRAGYVTKFIRELRDGLRDAGKDMPIAVYNSGIYGREDSRRTVLQDWRQWHAEQLVDEHHPMFLMTGGRGNLIHAVKSLVKDKPDKTTVFGPIFLAEGYKKTQPTPDDVRDAARRMIKAGCDGLWFCRVSEIEEYALWPVVKEISSWSISEIRAEPFDPTRVNLLGNGDFTDGLSGWRCEPEGVATVLKPGEVRLASGLAVESALSQIITFEPLNYMPVASLDVSLDVWADEEAIVGDLRLTVQLIYVGGDTQTHELFITSTGDGWHEHKLHVPVEADYKDRVLDQARLTIHTQTDAGPYRFRDIRVERDHVLH